jgi:chemotaxis protein CheZ
MPPQKLDPQLVDQIDDLRDGKIRQVGPDEIVKVVQNIIDGLNADVPSLELAVRANLEELADYIQVAKTEILSFDPEGISDEHLPIATVELDAIVRSTEEATNSIMEAAETIEGMAAELDADKNDALIEETTRIFEACGFQDITGQRISKVIKALQDIESKIEGLISIFGDNDPEAREQRRRQRAAENGTSVSVGEIDERELLEGPQLPDNAVSQDDIDALLASMD